MIVRVVLEYEILRIPCDILFLPFVSSHEGVPFH